MANKRGKSYECPDVAAMMMRMARGLTKRAAQDKDLESMSALRDVAAEVDRQMGEAARALIANGYSWNDIGREYGCSRQSAQQRWGKAK